MGPRNRCKIAALLIGIVIFGLLECLLLNRMSTLWLESTAAAASVAEEEAWVWARAFKTHKCTGQSKFTLTKSDGRPFRARLHSSAGDRPEQINRGEQVSYCPVAEADPENLETGLQASLYLFLRFPQFSTGLLQGSCWDLQTLPAAFTSNSDAVKQWVLFQEGYLHLWGLGNSLCLGAWDPGRNRWDLLNFCFCGNARKQMQRFRKAECL